MPLRDSWHRTLVYFGLAEEPDDYDEYEPSRCRSTPRRRSRTATASVRTSGASRVAAAATSSTTSSPTTRARHASAARRRRALRSVAGGRRRRGSAAGDFGVHLVIPKSFNDAQQVADKFRDGIPVILNLQGIDTPLVMRLIDFASGLTYALDGGMQRIADKVFMLTPRNVELSAEERARLIEKGFFNQA